MRKSEGEISAKGVRRLLPETGADDTNEDMSERLVLSDPLPEIYQRMMDNYPRRLPEGEPHLVWRNKETVTARNFALRNRNPGWPDHLFAIGERRGGLEVYVIDLRYPAALVRTLPGGNPGSGFGREEDLPPLETWLVRSGQSALAKALAKTTGGRRSIALSLILMIAAIFLGLMFSEGEYQVAGLVAAGVCGGLSIYFLDQRRFHFFSQLAGGVVFLGTLAVAGNAFLSGGDFINPLMLFFTVGLPGGRYLLRGPQPSYPCRHVLSFRRRQMNAESAAWTMERDLLDQLKRWGFKPSRNEHQEHGEAYDIDMEGDPMRLYLWRERDRPIWHFRLRPKPGFATNVLGHVNGHAFARLCRRLNQYLRTRGDVHTINWYRENRGGQAYDFGHMP